jgi:hypothetical protein
MRSYHGGFWLVVAVVGYSDGVLKLHCGCAASSFMRTWFQKFKELACFPMFTSLLF